MSDPVPSFFEAVNRQVGPTGTPFLNFGYVALDDRGRPRGGRRSATATSVTLLRTVLAETDLAGASVLEVGCGRGGNLRWLRRHRHPAALVGLDLSPAAVRASHLAGDAVGVVGDAVALPVRSGGVDAVVNIESSCLYGDLRGFYAEVARVLAPGGTFAYADVLPRSFRTLLVPHLAAIGLVAGTVEDVTTNVLASVDARRAELGAGPADDFLAWFAQRLGAGDLAYLHLTARWRTGPLGDPVPLPSDGLATLRAFVAEAIDRARPAT